MKKLMSLILLFVLFLEMNVSLVAQNVDGTTEQTTLSQTSDSELKNQDILNMFKSGLSAEIILAKIKSSKCVFDTTPKALQELKAAGVPEIIIIAMVEFLSSGEIKTAVVKIPDNTAISVESAYDVSSATVKNGNMITFRVVNPLVINGATVIEKGALVNGKIAVAKKAGRWGREGELGWIFEDVIAVDGKSIPIKAEDSIKGESNKGEVAIKATALGLLLAPTIVLTPLALMYGFKRGKNAVLPAGSRFVVYINGDALVTANIKQKPTEK